MAEGMVKMVAIKSPAMSPENKRNKFTGYKAYVTLQKSLYLTMQNLFLAI